MPSTAAARSRGPQPRPTEGRRLPGVTSALLASLVAVAGGCGRTKPIDIGSGSGGSGGSGAGGADTPSVLVGAPLAFAPTANGFGLNVVLRSGDPVGLLARVRDGSAADAAWMEIGPPAAPASAPDVAQWWVTGLQPGRRYQYEIRRADGSAPGAPIYAGSVATAPAPGTPFTFAVLGDSHIGPRDPLPVAGDIDTGAYAYEESVLQAVAAEVRASDPDFIVNLGDSLDFHRFGFNDPPPAASWTRLGYLNFRRLMGDTLGRAAHFQVIGNWDGENGCDTDEEIERSRSQRLLYIPGPRPDTYPQGGSATEDYYAFVWGDALFVVLNVMSYTPTCHLLGIQPGLPDDWTLGTAQLAWLDQTLSRATAKWRFTFIHHAVGGAAGNAADSAYGRGGGRAAHVGEQAIVHDLLVQHGVQVFFYGHDHVFTDMTVDGVHYTLPGSAGAPWKFDQSETGYTSYWPDSGYGRVTVGPDRARIEFVGMGNRVLDTIQLP